MHDAFRINAFRLKSYQKLLQISDFIRDRLADLSGLASFYSP